MMQQREQQTIHDDGVVEHENNVSTGLLSSSIQQTDFQTWIEKHVSLNNGDKTTLEQQVGLAMQLWKESLSLPTTTKEENKDKRAQCSNHSPEQVIAALKQTPTQSADNLVSWKGFQVGWFLNVFCKTPFFQKLLEFDCELWFIRKVCIVEIIRQTHCATEGNPTNNNEVLILSDPFVNVVGTILDGLGLEGKVEEIVQKPTTFISYTGGYTLKQMVEALQQLDPKEYIWMDIFCVNQFAWTGKSRSPEMKHFKETFLDELQGQIQNMRKTALILEQWDNIMRTLEQIWVLWEIFNTADAGVELDVILPHHQTQDFVSSCLDSRQKFDDIMASLAAVDANKARAENNADQTQILNRIQTSGVTKVNNLSADSLRMWMQKQGMVHLEKLKMDGGEEGPRPEFLNNLANLLKVLGKLDEAEPLYRQALEKWQKIMGPEHPDTLSSLNSLAVLLKKQGKLDEAELLYQQVLEKRQKIMGPEHPHTLATLNSLANLLKDLGKLREAEPLYRQALEKRQKILGPEHPDTLSSLNNLAVMLKEQGKLDEAEPLCRQVLEKRQKILGPEHLDTLATFNNLAIFLEAQGKLDEAELFYREALEKQQKILGPDHPDTLVLLNNLAILLSNQGKLDEAEPLYRQALEKQQRVLGPEHPNTLVLLNNLAILLKAQGKLDEAEPLYRKALEKQQRFLGSDHPDTLVLLNNLAVLLSDLDKLDESEPLYRQALEKRQKILGSDHPDTLDSLNNLAVLLSEQGKLDEAEPLYRQALEKRQKILGPEHSDTLCSLNNLDARRFEERSYTFISIL